MDKYPILAEQIKVRQKMKPNLILSYLLLCFLLMTGTVIAQKQGSEWQLGYFAPYITHIGGTMGYSFDLKNSAQKRQHLQLLTSISYFSQIRVSNHIFLNPEVTYRWHTTGKRFFLSAAIAPGYLLSFQKQEGTLNLATGEIDYRYDVVNSFVPNLNAGLGIEPKKSIGFYVKASYGRRFNPESIQAAFMALSAGFIFKLNAQAYRNE